jgi:hypothetical protein
MGIDVALLFKGGPESWEYEYGQPGYIRENYGMPPYACKVLFKEAWARRTMSIVLNAATLEDRLARAIQIEQQHAHEDMAEQIQTYRDFVAKARQLEAKGILYSIRVSY